jgi:aerobic carbon-monoxide dehydrogenase small subunit
VTVHPFDKLLDVLRRERGVRSASRGCQDGTCGACRVLVDGRLVNACMLKWGEIPEGAQIESYENLENDPAAVRAVDAFLKERPTRCRLCVGALGVTAVAISRNKLEVDEAIGEATCICTGRGSWRRALKVV